MPYVSLRRAIKRQYSACRGIGRKDCEQEKGKAEQDVQTAAALGSISSMLLPAF
jgi:hypothetical protein